MLTGIVVALREELPTLTQQRLVKGQVSKLNETTLITYSGAGDNNARSAANLLLSSGATQLISWGCAAALNPKLKSGDLVLATAIISLDNPSIRINNAWHNSVNHLLADKLTVHHGELLSSKVLINTCSEKQHLFENTKAIALDMESYAIAEVARNNNIPFLAIRVIADTATMALPKAVSYSLNSDGEVQLLKLLSYLLRHPNEISKLIKLGNSFSRAKKSLLVIAKINNIGEFR
ncbi:MAG: phosphorylase [Methylococcaceae bacterium]